MAYITDGRITKNFSLAEMTNKQAGDTIKLVLTPEVVEHAQMMQELRDWANANGYTKTIEVSSWYRTKTFNKAVGGDKNSEHLDGLATDVNNIDTTNAKTVQAFTTAWQVICSIHSKIGNVGVYKWGMHFGSNADRFGYKTFRYKDNR